MNKAIILAAAALLSCAGMAKADNNVIGKNNIKLSSDLMTPEALWAMGRIGGYDVSPDGRTLVYNVTYYSVAQNKSRSVIYTRPVIVSTGDVKAISSELCAGSDATWLDNQTVAYMSKGQLHKINVQTKADVQLTNDKIDIEGYKFSPDHSRVILIKSLPYHGSIQKNPDDLPLATGRLITDMNYRHWDHYVESIPHPFVAEVNGDKAGEGKDIMAGEPYECPMAPFGGVEQLAWSPDGKQIAYTARKKEGVQYAISTDADIYLYDLATGTTRNLCKPEGYKEPEIDATKSMRDQKVNHQAGDLQVGYDQNPQFSPDGKYIAWQSMARNGYESDRSRLCVMELATGKKTYVTERFDTNVDQFIWGADSRTFYFTACWHATTQVYQTNLQGEVKQLTKGQHDVGSIALRPAQKKPQLIAEIHSMVHAPELYLLTPGKKFNNKNTIAGNYNTKAVSMPLSTTAQSFDRLTDENDHIFSQLASATVEERWVTTTDGKQMQVWVILPPHFDKTKKYPTLLYCEGGPQSPVSQFWSYRWNFSIMAAHGYVIIAPNRRGLPGYGSEWNEAVSQDWTGQCMKDYLSAIDDAAQNLPYVDRDRLGAVGASFGGFSVYYLAGHHNKRFKCFIAHDGAFNLESMYTDTEEAWFSNWEYDDAPWNQDQTDAAHRTYENSPHNAVQNWDTPILCIHGEKDYRINANQGFGAFDAARMKGIPAELLLFPDENHWVLKPQNGILWQRTFFNWLDRWLKK